MNEKLLAKHTVTSLFKNKNHTTAKKEIKIFQRSKKRENVRKIHKIDKVKKKKIG